MQHTESCIGSGSVADEAQEEDLLHQYPEGADVGSLAAGRVPAPAAPRDRLLALRQQGRASVVPVARTDDVHLSLSVMQLHAHPEQAPACVEVAR